ncbi:MAG: PD40 domain-containing protein [Armatimonadetes bacterium]|nr:PD40 domain-containing protein [Armatimonadota bacterium]MDE2205128.1 PD40 domain-containing protein [Armatimonadota bacterium]
MPPAPARTPTIKIPDWWEREKRRRQVVFLIFLTGLLILIGYYYWASITGLHISVSGIHFSTRDSIAFVREDRKPGSTSTTSTLYDIRADGTALHRLTDPSDISDKSAPAWTVDGKEILYASNRDDASVRQIFILGTGEPKQLTYGKANKDAPEASPDGKHIAFLAQGAVKTVYLNGEDVYQVMPTPQAGNSGSDDSGGDGSGLQMGNAFLRCAFSSDGTGIAGVQNMNSDVGDINIGGVTQPAGDEAVTAVPPQGTQALFLETGHSVSFAWDQTAPRLLTSFTEIEAPVQGKIRNISGIREWDLSNPDHPVSKALILCVGSAVETEHIALSPDGKRLAFEVWKVDKADNRSLLGITVVQVPDQTVQLDAGNLSGIRFLVRSSAKGVPERPQWSPDGTRILYQVRRPQGGHDLWVVDSDGTNPINLTNGAGDNTQAVWSPLK